MCAYVGGKARCTFILDVLNHPAFDNLPYLEPFVGYGHVLRRVVNKSSYTASDSNELLMCLLRAIKDGTALPQHISRERYAELRASNEISVERALAAFCYSFNGKCFAGYAPTYRRRNGRLDDQAKGTGPVTRRVQQVVNVLRAFSTAWFSPAARAAELPPARQLTPPVVLRQLTPHAESERAAAAECLSVDDDGFVTAAGCAKHDGEDIDHSVTLVGYGTDAAKGDFWIIKNSWGAAFADGGYVYMARGVNCASILEADAGLYTVGPPASYYPWA